MPTKLSLQRRRPSIMAVAVGNHHHHSFKPPIGSRHCRLRSFAHPNPTLFEPEPISSTSPSPSFSRSFSTPCLSQNTVSTAIDEPSNSNAARIKIVCGRRAIGVHALIVEAAVALASGAQLVPVSKGLSGAYYLHNSSGEKFAVIKPVDNDSSPLELLSPTGANHPMRSEECGAHEVAAYVLDHGSFSGVPPTALIKISHPIAFSNDVTPMLTQKLASIQRFVPHDFDAGEIGPSRFSVSSVHRIGILDVRLMNVDRHAGNMLVKKQKIKSFDSLDGYGNDSVTELVPVDHGLCLPEILDDPYFEWLHWPQASVPFSEAEIEYVAALDPFHDAEILHSEVPGLSEASLRVLIFCSIFLKRAVEADFCLADIGDMMTRQFCGMEEGSSMLEMLCKKTEESMRITTLSPYTASSTPEPSSNGEDDDEEAKDDQFDMEQENEHELNDMCIEDVVDVPLLLQSKSPVKESAHSIQGEQANEICDDKVQSITKSVSCISVADFNNETNSISFKGLSEEEWKLFLKRFEQLLPEVFEERKSMGLSKQRLGTSCKF